MTSRSSTRANLRYLGPPGFNRGQKMRLAFWNRRDECGCREERSAASCEQEVEPMSPARLLFKSLTELETRSEWAKKFKTYGFGSGAMVYTNAARDLAVSRSFGPYHSSLNTPFTLNAAEERLVGEALKRFDEHLSDERQKAALARLIAPRKGLQRDSGETAQTGSTRRAKARPRRGAPSA